MPFSNWKRCALGAYYGMTWSARRRAARDRVNRQTEPVRILFYHRVADDLPNDWTMPTREFAKQIRWLCARYELVTLAEAQQRIAARQNRVPTVCITFDDGYADNMRFAVPLLLNHNIPFTYFVSTNHVLGNQPFPHDVEANQMVSPNTPSQLRELVAEGVEIGAHTRSHADLGGSLSKAELRDEILDCKRELEQTIDREVRYFAFPYGQQANLSTAAFRVAYEAGYAGVCSAYGGYNFPGNDPFHLRRIHADPELIRLKNWLTIDPRKLKNHQDFDPGNYRAPVKKRVTHGR